MEALSPSMHWPCIEGQKWLGMHHLVDSGLQRSTAVHCTQQVVGMDAYRVRRKQCGKLGSNLEVLRPLCEKLVHEWLEEETVVLVHECDVRPLANWPHEGLEAYGCVQAPKATTQDANAWPGVWRGPNSVAMV